MATVKAWYNQQAVCACVRAAALQTVGIEAMRRRSAARLLVHMVVRLSLPRGADHGCGWHWQGCRKQLCDVNLSGERLCVCQGPVYWFDKGAYLMEEQTDVLL